MTEQIVFIGGKPFMNYVTAVVMQFTTNGANEVIVRSRGKFINRAVDVAEIVNSRFLNDSVIIKDVKIGSEDFKNREGRQIRVSTIDIYLNKINPIPTTKGIIEKTEEEEIPIEIIPKKVEAPTESVEKTITENKETGPASEENKEVVKKPNSENKDIKETGQIVEEEPITSSEEQ